MHFRMANALLALRHRSCSHRELRKAMPLLVKLYDGMLKELSGPTVSIEDLCVVMTYGDAKTSVDAAQRLLTEPNLVLDDVTLGCILRCVPEHADDAAMLLIVQKAPTREVLADIITYSRGHAHEAAVQLLMMDPTSEELGLIIAYVPALNEEVCMRLGAFAGMPEQTPQA